MCLLSEPLTQASWLSAPELPSPTVQTGDKVDGRSETSWTLSTADQGGCRMPFHEVSRMDARLEFVMLACGGSRGSSIVPSVRHQPDDRLQMAGAVANGRDDGARGEVASAAAFAGAQR